MKVIEIYRKSDNKLVYGNTYDESLHEEMIQNQILEKGFDSSDYELKILPYIDPQEAIEALKYLNSTDWYVVRKLETDVAVPLEVLEKRAQARLKVGG